MVIILEILFCLPVAFAPITPPAGPDSNSPIGLSDEFSIVEIPPFDCIILTWQPIPLDFKRVLRLLR